LEFLKKGDVVFVGLDWGVCLECGTNCMFVWTAVGGGKIF
jgi:hypothetical protein